MAVACRDKRCVNLKRNAPKASGRERASYSRAGTFLHVTTASIMIHVLVNHVHKHRGRKMNAFSKFTFPVSFRAMRNQRKLRFPPCPPPPLTSRTLRHWTTFCYTWASLTSARKLHPLVDVKLRHRDPHTERLDLRPVKAISPIFYAALSLVTY